MRLKLLSSSLAISLFLATGACDDAPEVPVEAAVEAADPTGEAGEAGEAGEEAAAEEHALPEAFAELLTDRDPSMIGVVGALDVAFGTSHLLVPRAGFNGLYTRVIFHAREDIDPAIEIIPMNQAELMDFHASVDSLEVEEDTLRLGALAAGETAELVIGVRVAELARNMSDEFLQIVVHGDDDAAETFTLTIGRTGDRDEARGTRDVALMENVWTLRAERAIQTALRHREQGDLDGAGRAILREREMFEAHLSANTFSEEFLTAHRTLLDDHEALARQEVDEDEGDEGDEGEEEVADAEDTP